MPSSACKKKPHHPYPTSRQLTTSRLPHIFFFFNDTATTEIYTLSLHDALPIYLGRVLVAEVGTRQVALGELHHRAGPLDGHGPALRATVAVPAEDDAAEDRKSTRLNSSHTVISYAVFCLQKKTAPPLPHLSTANHLETPSYFFFF